MIFVVVEILREENYNNHKQGVTSYEYVLLSVSGSVKEHRL